MKLYILIQSYALDVLKCSEKGIACSKKMTLNGNFSKPIILQVIINNYFLF